MDDKTTDPLAGIPESDRVRILRGGDEAWKMAPVGGPEAERARQTAIAAGVAAYRAAQPAQGLVCSCGALVAHHEAHPITDKCDLGGNPYGGKRLPAEPKTLTREQAETALRALGHHPHMVDEFLHDAQKHLDNNSYLRPGTYDVLRAYVRHLAREVDAGHKLNPEAAEQTGTDDGPEPVDAGESLGLAVARRCSTAALLQALVERAGTDKRRRDYEARLAGTTPLDAPPAEGT